jgi:acetyl-CoA carboxylase carboxyl transferase subunit beta
MFRSKPSTPQTIQCSNCHAEHTTESLEQWLYICPKCNHYLSIPVRVRIASLADPRTFREFDRKLASVDPLKFIDGKSYLERLKEARRATGVREAVATGLCRIIGWRAVLVVFDFEFLG